jgi:hypothetical protein
MARAIANSDKLEAIVMAALHEHPECQVITGVKIRPLESPTANWEAAPVVRPGGSLTSDGRTRLQKVLSLLSEQYELED